MARPKVLSLLAVLLLTACTDVTAPNDLRIGRYTLARVNGAVLPGAVLENSNARLELMSGALWLHREGNFTDSTQARVTTIPGGSVRLVTDVAAGTFRISHDTLYLSSTRGEMYHMVFSAAGSLMQELNGSTLTYRK